MTFGQEARVVNLSLGLNLFTDPANVPPGTSIVATNLRFDEVGTLKKRTGFTRGIQRQFSGFISGIAPTQNCFGIQGILVSHANIDLRDLG